MATEPNGAAAAIAPEIAARATVAQCWPQILAALQSSQTPPHDLVVSLMHRDYPLLPPIVFANAPGEWAIHVVGRADAVEMVAQWDAEKTHGPLLDRLRQNPSPGHVYVVVLRVPCTVHLMRLF